MNDHVNHRRLPPPISENVVSNKCRNGHTLHEHPRRAPYRAMRVKAEALRVTVRNGNPLDWSDICERYLDLWQEARLAIWRAKHGKSGLKQADPQTGQQVLTFGVDEKLVLQAIDPPRGIVDSLIKLRREMGHEATGIPRWAIERIELALRDHPEALNALLKEQADEDEKQAEEE